MDSAPAPLPQVTYQEEDGRGILVEAMPLFQTHWREIATHQDIPLQPDAAVYQDAADAKILRCYTARSRDWDLIGYAVYFVRTHPHYASSLQAFQDILFVRAEWRRGALGSRLIAFADDQLRKLGVQITHQHVKVAHNFGPLLVRQGYELVEHIYSKRLDK